MSFEGRSWADMSDDDDDTYGTMLMDYEKLMDNPVAPPRAPSPPAVVLPTLRVASPRSPTLRVASSRSPTKRAMFPENALAAILQQAHTMRQSHHDTVELEVRLGRQCGSHFDSGVPRATFESLMAHCRKLATQAPHETHETSILFTPTHDSQARYRATLEAKSKRVKGVCEKIRHRNLDLATVPFDVRLSLASENAVAMSLTETPTGYARHKQRWSFQMPLLTGCRVDLTRVVVDDTSTPRYEVEIEFDMQQLPSAQQVQYTYDTLFATFFDTTSLSPAFLDIPLVTTTTMRPETWHATMTSALHEAVDLRRDKDKVPRYLGSMPITFLRHYIPRLRDGRQPYYVAEKTDGERYLLFARPGQPALLINRATDFLPIATTKRTTFTHPIVLDGEMVRDVRSFQPVFLVFDVLAIKGHALLGLPFRERNKHLANLRFDTMRLPFKITLKRYHPLSKLKSGVFQCIQRHPLTKERLFRDTPNKLIYRTDGVIFQPNRPYRMGTDYSFFKYKYADELTVEFAMRYVLRNGQRDRQRYQLCLNQRGQRQYYIYRTYALRDLELDERARLTHLLESKSPAIGEFCYDAKVGRWVLLAPRYDKRTPNIVDILLDTLELLTQKLTPKQLVDALV